MGNAAVVVIEPLGAETLVHLSAGGLPLVVRLPGLVELRAGDSVGVKLDRRRLHLFDVAGGRLAGSACPGAAPRCGGGGPRLVGVAVPSGLRTVPTTPKAGWRTPGP